MKASRISKIGGVTLAGLVAASVAADKVQLGPVASQLAGFLGAFVGTLVARRMTADRNGGSKEQNPTRKQGPPSSGA